MTPLPCEAVSDYPYLQVGQFNGLRGAEDVLWAKGAHIEAAICAFPGTPTHFGTAVQRTTLPHVIVNRGTNHGVDLVPLRDGWTWWTVLL